MPASIQSQALQLMSIRCFLPGVKPGPGPLKVPSPSTLSGAFVMLLGLPPPHTHSHTGFGCPSRALVPQISPPQPVQPIPPIRPRRRGSAVTHRRAGAVGGPECAHFLTARTCPALLEHSPSGPPADVFCPRGGSARQPPPLSLRAKPRAALPPPTSHNWHLQRHQESRG